MSPIQKEINDLKVKLKEARKWLKIIPNIECNYNYLSGDVPSIHLRTHNYDVLLKTLRSFARRGFRIIKRDEGYDLAHFYFTLKNKNGDMIHLWFSVSATKSCKRIKIGEEIKPIYKIVCE